MIGFLLICNSAGNNCRKFLTMSGEDQEMSIMLCMNKITVVPIAPSTNNTSNTNLSTLDNKTKYNTTLFNTTMNDSSILNHVVKNTTETNDTFYTVSTTPSMVSPNTTNITIFAPKAPSPVQSPTSEAPSPSNAPSGTDTEDLDTSKTTKSVDILTPTNNLRGNSNSSNTSTEDKNIEIDKDLDISMIIIIVICSVVGSLTVTGLICVYCRHRQSPCSIMPEIIAADPILPPKNIKIKRTRSERPRDLIIERPLKQTMKAVKASDKIVKSSDKIVKAPHNVQLTQNAITTIARLRRVQKRTSKKAPYPPQITHSGESKQPPPPPIPPRSHLKAMKAAKKLLQKSTGPTTEPINQAKPAKKSTVYLL